METLEGTKPKGMHWRTFHRLVHELEAREYRSKLSFIDYFEERFAHLGEI